jgi:hypothetical protein
MRRVAAAISAAALLVAGCTVTASEGNAEVSCELSDDTVFVLMAQAVPSATLVPCILEFPAGWSYGGSDVRRGVARYWLSSDRGGVRSVEIELSTSCDVTGLAERMDPAAELGVRVYQEPLSYQPYAANRYFVFEGGCVSYRWRFAEGAEEAPNLAYEAVAAMTFLPRSHLVRLVDREIGLTLCGAEAPPCIDGT